jgi:hypothetical protein
MHLPEPPHPDHEGNWFYFSENPLTTLKGIPKIYFVTHAGIYELEKINPIKLDQKAQKMLEKKDFLGL